jgi:hypothetical protein
MTHAAILACADPHTGVLTFVPAHQPRGRAGRIAVARGNANDMTVVRKACIRERNGDVRVPGVAEAEDRGDALMALVRFADGIARRDL